jgi:hypothetical protein
MAYINEFGLEGKKRMVPEGQGKTETAIQPMNGFHVRLIRSLKQFFAVPGIGGFANPRFQAELYPLRRRSRGHHRDE